MARTVTNNVRSGTNYNRCHLIDIFLADVKDSLPVVTASDNIEIKPYQVLYLNANETLLYKPSTSTYYISTIDETFENNTGVTTPFAPTNIIVATQQQIDEGSKIRLTDNDIMTIYNNEVYLPLSVSFDDVVESYDLQVEDLSIVASNLNEELVNLALLSEWRNSNITITRVFYDFNSFQIQEEGLYPTSTLYPSEVLYPSNGKTIDLEFGMGETFTDFPKLDLDSKVKDVVNLFDGLISSFSATESTISLKCNSELSRWQKTINTLTFNQREFETIINTMSETIEWGT